MRHSVRISLNSRQQKVVWAGLILILLMCLFPPWVYTIDYARDGASVHSEKPAGYGSLFFAPDPLSYSVGHGIRIDLTRLFIQFVFLATSTLLGFILTKDKGTKEEEVIELTEVVHDVKKKTEEYASKIVSEKAAPAKSRNDALKYWAMVIANEKDSVARAEAFSAAKKWASWLAGLGAMVGISAVMKGSGSIVGKLLLGAAAGGILALMLGGVTFLLVYGVQRLRGR